MSTLFLIWLVSALVVLGASVVSIISLVVEGTGSYLTETERQVLRISILLFFMSPLGILILPVGIVGGLGFGIFKLGRAAHTLAFVKEAGSR